MASASAWFDLSAFSQSGQSNNEDKSKKMKRSNSLTDSFKYGLLCNIDPSLSHKEIGALINECFDLKSLNLFTYCNLTVTKVV